MTHLSIVEVLKAHEGWTFKINDCRYVLLRLAKTGEMYHGQVLNNKRANLWWVIPEIGGDEILACFDQLTDIEHIRKMDFRRPVAKSSLN